MAYVCHVDLCYAALFILHGWKNTIRISIQNEIGQNKSTHLNVRSFYVSPNVCTSMLAGIGIDPMTTNKQVLGRLFLGSTSMRNDLYGEKYGDKINCC